MSREGWDDFGQLEPTRSPGSDSEPLEGEHARHSGEELAQELDHWIRVFEDHMDSSIEEGWVHLHLELGQLLNLLAVMRAASWVLRARMTEEVRSDEEP